MAGVSKRHRGRTTDRMRQCKDFSSVGKTALVKMVCGVYLVSGAQVLCAFLDPGVLPGRMEPPQVVGEHGL